mgnify:CR=1 FL=1
MRVEFRLRQGGVCQLGLALARWHQTLEVYMWLGATIVLFQKIFGKRHQMRYIARVVVGHPRQVGAYFCLLLAEVLFVWF